MAATRKLQGEIERCLKKVTEGVETFEDIWQKVHNATNSNQKEKYEADLKKEIKKLQRLRDQIKSWIASGEIKDKSTLLDYRKLIETQMERFKVVERETKTKAYSKEGLGAAQKMDPAQKEREEVSTWLVNSIDSLNQQLDQFESEIESLLAGKKKRLDKEKQDRLDELKSKLERHRYHIRKLETLLRMLDNMSVEVSQIKGIKDNVEYYIECSQEPGFEESEYIYDEIIGLDEIELSGVGLPSSATTDSNGGSPTSMTLSPAPSPPPPPPPPLGGGALPQPSPLATLQQHHHHSASSTTNTTHHHHNQNDYSDVSGSAAISAANTNTITTLMNNSSSSSSTGDEKSGGIVAASTTAVSKKKKESSGVSSAGEQIQTKQNVVKPTAVRATSALLNSSSGGSALTSVNNSTGVVKNNNSSQNNSGVVGLLGGGAATSPNNLVVANNNNNNKLHQQQQQQQQQTPNNSSPSSGGGHHNHHPHHGGGGAPPSSLHHNAAAHAQQSNFAAVAAAVANAAAVAAASQQGLSNKIGAHATENGGILPGGLSSLVSHQQQQHDSNSNNSSLLHNNTSSNNNNNNSVVVNNSNNSSSSPPSSSSVSSAESPAPPPMAASTPPPLPPQQQQQQSAAALAAAAAAAAAAADQAAKVAALKCMAQQVLDRTTGLDMLAGADPSRGLFDSSSGGNSGKKLQQQQQQQHGGTTSEAHIPPLLGVAPLGPVPLQKEHQCQFQMMESAYYHMPHPADSERVRQYLARSPCPTPPYYNQVPLAHSDTLEFFQRLSTETLFFIFYYMEGSKAQYMAAKALKKQSWRFHTKYMMWFQRHEEPKLINEEYEQGTYIYFDYEKWGQRKKECFTFEYKYLEDRDLN